MAKEGRNQKTNYKSKKRHSSVWVSFSFHNDNMAKSICGMAFERSSLLRMAKLQFSLLPARNLNMESPLHSGPLAWRVATLNFLAVGSVEIRADAARFFSGARSAGEVGRGRVRVILT
uniref:Uncharacterized protein n=1 Tax=Setaria viridis TaxID=4556 RepID=A0A4U6SVX4_SETVI|nr:hypothetical protein SEVIR_9G173100v2 [Setaria viridis]